MYRIHRKLNSVQDKHTIQKKFHAGSKVFYKVYSLNYKLVITSSEPDIEEVCLVDFFKTTLFNYISMNSYQMRP